MPEPTTPWRRSTYCSSAACVEVRRSSKCSASNCVEVLHEPGTSVYQIRDSKNPNVVLAFTEEEWLAFEAGVSAGEFRFGPSAGQDITAEQGAHRGD